MAGSTMRSEQEAKARAVGAQQQTNNQPTNQPTKQNKTNKQTSKQANKQTSKQTNKQTLKHNPGLTSTTTSLPSSSSVENEAEIASRSYGSARLNYRQGRTSENTGSERKDSSRATARPGMTLNAKQGNSTLCRLLSSRSAASTTVTAS